MLGQSGTVTPVTKNAVTIKTSAGTKTYTVTADSDIDIDIDIDKSGEATLADLKAGDAVRFSTTTATGTTIDRLYAGNEALDGPSGGHH